MYWFTSVVTEHQHKLTTHVHMIDLKCTFYSEMRKLKWSYDLYILFTPPTGAKN